MSVVLDAADSQGLHGMSAGDTADVCPQLGLQLHLDAFAALFGREDAMHKRR